ncbi:hypothetical protein HK103_004461 [Boothiomyces macroporosus]|uniref:Uncharacterized protein n=1 Tax=Boothiomyces macroporosus TaxID=261099 RepID=A0AAD5UGI7_9FUNG|nr:hypothetical protein HK103_004461 [Boothiomyces macroporosus]
MSLKYQSHTVGFPVFTVTNAGNNSEFLVGGGGGGTKVNSKLELEIVSEHVFDKTDDGCMTVAAHPTKRAFIAGVNKSAEEIKKGNNINARFFLLQNNSMVLYPDKSVATLSSTDPYHFQKCSRFTRDGKIFISGTSEGYLTMWNWPDMTPYLSPMNFDNEITDIHVDSNNANIAVVTSDKLRVLDLQKGKIRWAYSETKFNNIQCEIRCARYNVLTRFGNENELYLVLNSKSKKDGFILKFDTSTWQLKKSKRVCSKPITAFNISDNGKLLCFGSADMSINVIDSERFSVTLY